MTFAANDPNAVLQSMHDAYKVEILLKESKYRIITIGLLFASPAVQVEQGGGRHQYTRSRAGRRNHPGGNALVIIVIPNGRGRVVSLNG